MDEMSEKFLTKLGVNHIDEVISSVHEREGRHFMDHITSCNKVRDNTTIFVFKNIDKYCTNKLHTCLQNLAPFVAKYRYRHPVNINFEV